MKKVPEEKREGFPTVVLIFFLWMISGVLYLSIPLLFFKLLICFWER